MRHEMVTPLRGEVRINLSFRDFTSPKVEIKPLHLAVGMVVRRLQSYRPHADSSGALKWDRGICHNPISTLKKHNK
jgi:hypothetical protein